MAEVAGPWGIDCVIDNIGTPAVWEAYRAAVADMGSIVVSGAINHEPLPMRMLPFYLRSQSLIGVRTGNRAQMAALWQDVADGFRPPVVARACRAMAQRLRRTSPVEEEPRTARRSWR